MTFMRLPCEEQPERNTHQQDGILFQITATQQRKLDQLFPIHLLSLHRRKRCHDTRCHTDLSGNRADQDLAAVCLTKGDSSCGPSVVLSAQQMHMAGDNPISATRIFRRLLTLSGSAGTLSVTDGLSGVGLA